MRKKTKALCLAIAVTSSFIMLAGCSTTSTETIPTESTTPVSGQTHETITMALTTTNVNVNEDAFARIWNEKFNMDWEIVPMSSEDKATEMLRIWINSGDMPDVANWGYVNSDALSWTSQDLIKKLPDDWRTKWPNVANAYDVSGVGDKFDEIFGGTYLLPKPIYSSNMPVDTLIPHDGVWFRKDWIEAIGEEVKEYYTTQEIIDLMMKIKEQDPGNVGDSLVPLEVPTAKLPEIFIYPNNAHSQNVSQFYQDSSGVFHWGPADPATLEGLKMWRKAYDEGILHPEFYTLPVGRENEAALNQVGRTAMNSGAGMASVGTRYASFMRESLGLNPDEALEYAYVVDSKGDYLAVELPNFAGTVFFSPDLSDEKLCRIMDILDYSASEEGETLIHLGIEGEDWEMGTDGEPISLLGKDMQLAQKYISIQPLYVGMLLLPDNYSLVNPTLNKVYRDKARNQYINKTAKAKEIVELDYDVYFFDSKAKQQASFNLPEEYASIVLKGPNVEENFNDWVKEKMKIVQPVLDELTEMKKAK